MENFDFLEITLDPTTIWKFLSDVVEYPGEMSQGEGHPAIELNFGKF